MKLSRCGVCGVRVGLYVPGMAWNAGPRSFSLARGARGGGPRGPHAACTCHARHVGAGGWRAPAPREEKNGSPLIRDRKTQHPLRAATCGQQVSAVGC